MTTATLTVLHDKPNDKTLLVVFARCKTFDSFMFKNNVFNWLFTHTLGEFELSEDFKITDFSTGFRIHLNENRDERKLFKNFPDIIFEELDIRPEDCKNDDPQ